MHKQYEKYERAYMEWETRRVEYENLQTRLSVAGEISPLRAAKNITEWRKNNPPPRAGRGAYE